MWPPSILSFFCLITSTAQIAVTSHVSLHFFIATLLLRRWQELNWKPQVKCRGVKRGADACFNRNSSLNTHKEGIITLVWTSCTSVDALSREVERWSTDAAFWLDPCRKRASPRFSLACGLKLHYLAGKLVESAGLHIWNSRHWMWYLSNLRAEPAVLMKQSDKKKKKLCELSE